VEKEKTAEAFLALLCLITALKRGPMQFRSALGGGPWFTPPLWQQRGKTG